MVKPLKEYNIVPAYKYLGRGSCENLVIGLLTYLYTLDSKHWDLQSIPVNQCEHFVSKDMEERISKSLNIYIYI